MSIQKLHQIFKDNKSGIVPITQLQPLSRSNLRIQSIAHKYGYKPAIPKYSRKVTHYIHHSLQDKEVSWT